VLHSMCSELMPCGRVGSGRVKLYPGNEVSLGTTRG
jgi:hypothetical protein